MSIILDLNNSNGNTIYVISQLDQIQDYKDIVESMCQAGDAKSPYGI